MSEDFLTLEEYEKLAKKAKNVAIFREISSEISPTALYQDLKQYLGQGVMLESDLNTGGRFSYLLFDPIAEFEARGEKVTVGVNGAINSFNTSTPFGVLRELIRNLGITSREDKQGSINSAVGFVSYDAIRYFEEIPDQHQNLENMPEMLFKFYGIALKYDHQEKKLLISVLAPVEDMKVYDSAVKKIDNICQRIRIIPESTNQYNINNKKSLQSDISDEEFEKLVERAKKHVICGDVFQVVLSRRFTTQYKSSPFNIYCSLRHHNPSPYMFYLPVKDFVIIGASPEKMVSVKDNEVQINPIAGTYKNTTRNKDQHTIEQILLEDKKELAEHMMLVDLARNDIGSVSTPGSVNVKELLQVKHYPHVSHITSVVAGKLKNNLDTFDALAATFPAGTLSGAPKIRAMQIIDALETSRRGLYGGAICRLDLQGNFDSCIAIRMAILKDGIATMRAGAGIVYDSVPASEAQETRQKVKSIFDAICLAG